MTPDEQPRHGVTRRGMLIGSGSALGLAAAAGAGYAAGDAQSANASSKTVAFHGAHQAGIATPPQDRLVFGSFDFVGEGRDELRELLRSWTEAARRITSGKPVGAVGGAQELPPVDTGEAVGIKASRLTVTIGFGPSLFERRGRDRLGLRGRRPSSLLPLGDLPGDQFDPGRSDGDLCIQACADDPQVAFHAVRNLLRIGRGAVDLRWLQLGFGSNTSTGKDQPTPRNLMGFKDGTRNLSVDDKAGMDRFVWVGREEPQRWFRGGTYLVARRIRMLIETWDHSQLLDQEQTIGRLKASGAPLGGSKEFDTPNLKATRGGRPVIPTDAHIRMAAPSSNRGEEILRRSYAYTDGVDQRTGLLDAGLFFVCFQRDPQRQFAAIQRRLGASDGLNEYIQHTSSALFAIPPGARSSGYVGEGLFA
jgi:deferrochelatase/peroxidase EfeB